MRGDRPPYNYEKNETIQFTPHARGSTQRKGNYGEENRVYPACAGIDPTTNISHARIRSLPRMRGDRPLGLTSLKREEAFTPHARGSTEYCELLEILEQVYPACAGIDPSRVVGDHCVAGLPRMRGDRPCAEPGCMEHTKFTPHARGSTLQSGGTPGEVPVYPACAGIDLSSKSPPALLFSLPRMRGDRPGMLHHPEYPFMFTPHARGSTTA